MSYQAKKTKSSKSPHFFYNKFDKYEKVFHPGFERIFYGKESIGPGAYLGQNSQGMGQSKGKLGFSKGDRGLLKKPTCNAPGPHNYT